MKKLALLLAVILILSLSACAPSPGTNVTEKTKTDAAAQTESAAEESAQIDLTGFSDGWAPADVGHKTIGIVPWCMSQEFNSIVANTAKARCEQLGWDATIYDPDGDWSQMQSILEDLIAQQVDGIIFTAIDAAAASTMVERCHEAGIAIVDYDCCAADGNADMDVVYDDAMGGQLAAELMMQALDGKKDATIVVYEAEPSIASSGLRNNGLLNWLDENYPDLTIIQNRTTDRTNDGFYQWALNMYTAYPEVDAIFCNQGDLATATWHALHSVNADQVYLIGYDATSSHLQIMLDQGPDCNFYASIGMFPDVYATVCVEKLNEIFAGTYQRSGPEDQVMLTPVPLIASEAESWGK